MDLHLGEDMYESFVEYQTRMLAEFDRMVDRYGFHVIEASAIVDQVFEKIKNTIEPLLRLPHLKAKLTV